MKALRLSLSLTSGMAPALALDFLSGSLDARVTFTRGSTGTYFNSSGVLSSAAINTPRFDYDPVTLAPKGLLIEEARTNLLTYSDGGLNWSLLGTGTVTATTGVAPDGSNNAFTVTGATDVTAPVGGNNIYKTFNVSPSTTYTISLYVKAITATTVSINIFDGSTGANTTQAIALTSGWQRVQVARTSSGTTTGMRFTVGAANGTVLCWGAQAEAGAFATSYIPTVASTVTRSADVATMTGTNFSSWYNQSAGTFVVGADVNGSSATNPALFGATDGTSNNRINPFASGTNWVGYVSVGAVAQAAINSAGYSTGTPFKYAIASATNSFNAALNGTLGAEDTSGSLPTGLTQLALGCLTSGSLVLNGHIRQIAYYNTRLPDAQLQSLTA